LEVRDYMTDGKMRVHHVDEAGIAQDTDAIHPFGKHADWNESFYFNLYDKEKDICAFMRIGLKPNKNEKSMLCYIMMPDGSVLSVRDVEPCKVTELKVNGLQFRRIVPEKEWKMEFTGTMKRTLGDSIERRNVEFSLSYEAANKIFDYRDCAAGGKEVVSQVEAAEHTEQFGKIRGDLTIAGETINVKGFGEKDHAWGLTDWMAPTMWIWFSCQFSERFAFNLMKLIVGTEVVDAGYIHIDGDNRPIVRADLITEYVKGGGPKNIRMWLTEKDGTVHEVQADVLRSTKLPFGGILEKSVAVMHEALARFQLGNEVGYGVVEYLIRET